MVSYADAAYANTVETKLLVILARALDPEGKALDPLRRAYELGYENGLADGASRQATPVVSH